jgi:hypothetical protein
MSCSTCAFKSGCVTHDDEPYNRLKSEIAALAGFAFWCHHRKDGAKWDWDGAHAPIRFFEIHPSQRKVCDGWKQRVCELAAQGHFLGKERREEMREWGRLAYMSIDSFIASEDPEQKKRDLDCMRTCLHYLTGGEDSDLPGALAQIRGAANG